MTHGDAADLCLGGSQAEAARKGIAAVLGGVQRVQEGVRQLFGTAQTLEETHEAHAKDVFARHAKLGNALAKQVRHPSRKPRPHLAFLDSWTCVFQVCWMKRACGVRRHHSGSAGSRAQMHGVTCSGGGDARL